MCEVERSLGGAPLENEVVKIAVRFRGGIRPNPRPSFEARVKLAALPGLFPDSARLKPEGGCHGFDAFNEGCSVFHALQHNVIYHTLQRETSHFALFIAGGKPCA